MKRKLLNFFIAGIPLLFFGSSVAQEAVFKGALVEKTVSAEISSQVLLKLDKAFKKYELYSLNGKSIYEFVKNKEYAGFRLELGSHAWDLNLQLNDMRSQNHELVANTAQGDIVMPRLPATTWKGWANHNAGQQIRVSIYDGVITGYIMQDGEELFIEPAVDFIKEATGDLYIVYRSSDAILEAGLFCGVTEMVKAEENLQNTVLSSACMETELAEAADQLFTKEMGSVSATSTEIHKILNWVEGKYTETAVGISYKIVKEYIVDVGGTDPWSSSTDGPTLLQSFASWGNGGGFGVTHDMGFLITGRDAIYNGNAGLVGLAYTGGVCSGNKYGFTEHFIKKGDIGVFISHAHEMGHIWSCQHVNNQNSIMNASLVTTMTTWDQTSINSIANHKNSRACLTACTTTEVKETPAGKEKSVLVFPNPSNGDFTLTINWNEDEKIKIELLTMLGQPVYSEFTGGFKNSYSANLRLPELSKGLYIIRINEGMLLSKVLIE